MHVKFLEIEITGRCDCYCRHCYGNFPKPQQLPKEKIKEIIGQIPPNYHIIFSGGEPLLHEDLIEIVRDAEEYFWITTNGHALSREKLDTLSRYAILVFGLDGIGSVHDWYRGNEGSFKKVIDALELTQDRPVEIITTLWKGMLGQINDIIEIGAQYNAIVHFNPLVPVGRATSPEILLTREEKERVYEKIKALQKSRGIITELYKVTEKDLEHGIDLYCKDRFSIGVNGDVRPCEFHQVRKFGNIFEENLEEIIKRAKATDYYQARKSGFKNHIRLDAEDPFNYHTNICHKIPL